MQGNCFDHLNRKELNELIDLLRKERRLWDSHVSFEKSVDLRREGKMAAMRRVLHKMNLKTTVSEALIELIIRRLRLRYVKELKLVLAGTRSTWELFAKMDAFLRPVVMASPAFKLPPVKDSDVIEQQQQKVVKKKASNNRNSSLALERSSLTTAAINKRTSSGSVTRRVTPCFGNQKEEKILLQKSVDRGISPRLLVTSKSTNGHVEPKKSVPSLKNRRSKAHYLASYIEKVFEELSPEARFKLEPNLLKAVIAAITPASTICVDQQSNHCLKTTSTGSKIEFGPVNYSFSTLMPQNQVCPDESGAGLSISSIDELVVWSSMQPSNDLSSNGRLITNIELVDDYASLSSDRQSLTSTEVYYAALNNNTAIYDRSMEEDGNNSFINYNDPMIAGNDSETTNQSTSITNVASFINGATGVVNDTFFNDDQQNYGNGSTEVSS